jgi:hypothetical protein
MEQLNFFKKLDDNKSICACCKNGFENKKNYIQKYCSEACYKKVRKEKKVLHDKKYREKNKSVLIQKKKEYYKKNREIQLLKCKTWRENNKEHKAKTDKEYLLKNRERLLEYKKDYYQKNKKHLSEIGKTYRKENENKIKEYRLKNREKILKRKRDWSRENIKHVLQYAKNKRDTDIQYKIRNSIRNRINSAIVYQKTTKHCSSLKLLGCSIQNAKEHLEKQFKEGMTWDNYGHKTWHIDHIIPCASFDLTDTEQQKKCFHYTNLQPLWAKENISKGAKIL